MIKRYNELNEKYKGLLIIPGQKILYRIGNRISRKPIEHIDKMEIVT